MKKETLNKNILKAISIGLAAMMTLGPVSSFATEGDTGNSSASNGSDGSDGNETNASEIKKAETKNISEVREDIADAKEKISNAVQNENAGTAKEISDVISLINKHDEGSKDTQAEKDFANAELDKLNAENAEIAQEKLSDADDKLAEAEGIDITTESISDSISEADKVVKTYNENLDEISKVVATVDVEKIAAENKDAEKAKLEKAKADAVAAKEKAENDYKAAEQKYENAVKEYNDAIVEFNARIDSAANDAKAASEALSKLKLVKENAEKLKAEAETQMTEAQKEIERIEALDLGLEKEIKSWEEGDVLFSKVLSKYFLAEEAKKFVNAEAGETVEFSVGDWIRTEKRTNNWYPVTYTIKDANGAVKEVKTVNYNYKIAEYDKNGDNNNLKNYGEKGMVIYEKIVVNELINSKEAGTYAKVDADGKLVKDTLYDIDKANDKVADVEAVAVDKLTDENVGGAIVKNGEEYLLVDKNSETKKEDTTGKIVSNEKQLYKLDEEGNVVKEVKGDLTTVIVSETKSLAGSQTPFATKEEARTAAENELKGILEKIPVDENTSVEAIEKNVNVEEEHEVTGYYQSVFTATIDLSEYKYGYDDFRINGLDDAKAREDNLDNHIRTTIENATNKYLSEDEYEIDSIYYEYDYTETESTNKVGPVHRNFTISEGGTAMVTFRKLSTTEIDRTTWKAFKDLFTGDTSDEEKAMRGFELANKGTEAIDVKTFNWNFKTAKLKYVDAKAFSGSGKTSEEASENALKASNEAVQSQLTTDIKGAIYDIQAVFGNGRAFKVDVKAVEKAADEDKVQYNYTGSYKLQTTTTEKDKVLELVKYKTAKLKKINAEFADVGYDTNWKEGNNLLNTKNLIGELNKHKSVLKYYKELEKEVKEAIDAVNAADKLVADLEAEIRALKIDDAASVAKLAELKTKLIDAKDAKSAADEEYKKLIDKIDEKLGGIDEVVTPVDNGGNGGNSGGSNTGNGTGGSNTGSNAGGSTSGTNSGGTGGNAGSSGGTTANITDEATPLADIQDEATPLGEMPSLDGTQNIEDSEVPLGQLPQTGGTGAENFFMAGIASLLAGLGLRRRKEYKEEKDIKGSAK